MRRKRGRGGGSRKSGPGVGRRSSGTPRRGVISPAPVQGHSEFDQVSVVIVEEHLGLTTSDLDEVRAMCSKLPFEPSMLRVASLAGRVESVIASASKQLALARQVFRVDSLLNRYEALIRDEPRLCIFAPQSLYGLMRILVESAGDAPISRAFTAQEHAGLLRAVIASNSIIETGRDLPSPPSLEDYLAYELQTGSYHSRSTWLEEMVRPQELLRLSEVPELKVSASYVPIQEWLKGSGLDARQQWRLGFALGSVTNAWDETRSPHASQEVVDGVLSTIGLADRAAEALDLIGATRADLQARFASVPRDPERFVWETRPFNRTPFLRLENERGVLMMGRPWLHNWLSDGFYYRPFVTAQQLDADAAGGRTDHVQRYTAYYGEVFEQYCLDQARKAFPAGTPVVGEQNYGRGGGQDTSDVVVVCGHFLLLFEVHGRRIAAEPLIGGDPLEVVKELQKLLVKKINQLGVTIGALQSGEAVLPGIDFSKVRRVHPVVVTNGRLWQTPRLWDYLGSARDHDKCLPLAAEDVQPVQVLDARDYELLLALAPNHNVAGLLKRKTSGRWRPRDFAAWLAEDPAAPSSHARLPYAEALWNELADSIGPPSPSA